MKIEWSSFALDDLDRIGRFLHQHFPSIAPIAAQEIMTKAALLTDQPKLGRPIGRNERYRQIVLRVLNAPYVMQYREEQDRLVVLRVFHGREDRRRK